MLRKKRSASVSMDKSFSGLSAIYAFTFSRISLFLIEEWEALSASKVLKNSPMPRSFAKWYSWNGFGRRYGECRPQKRTYLLLFYRDFAGYLVASGRRNFLLPRFHEADCHKNILQTPPAPFESDLRCSDADLPADFAQWIRVLKVRNLLRINVIV